MVEQVVVAPVGVFDGDVCEISCRGRRVLEAMEDVGKGFAGMVVVVTEVDGAWVGVARSAGDMDGELFELGRCEVIGREAEVRGSE